MATNGSATKPARCTPEGLAAAARHLEDSRAFNASLGHPALHAWSVAFLLCEFFKLREDGAELSAGQAGMLEGVVRLLHQLTREVQAGALGPEADNPDLGPSFHATVVEPAGRASAIADLLCSFIMANETGEYSTEQIGILDGTSATLEELTRQVYEGAMEADSNRGRAQ